MRKIRLGQTNLMVSELGFGGIPIQRLSTDDAVGVVRRALDLGVTFLDSANGYTNSEERIGKAIAGRRDQVVLATKSGARNLATFKEHVALSFQRLGVDHIDVLQFHNVSDEEHYQQVVAGGMLEYAQALKAAGRIGHIGVTLAQPGHGLQAGAIGPLRDADVSLLRRHAGAGRQAHPPLPRSTTWPSSP